MDNLVEKDLQEVENDLQELLRSHTIKTTTASLWVRTLINLTSQYGALNNTYDIEKKKPAK